VWLITCSSLNYTWYLWVKICASWICHEQWTLLLQFLVYLVVYFSNKKDIYRWATF
jgi:hypothetical protein